MADPRHLLGRSAEDLAAEWLARAGWRVLAQRWRASGRGELDLVCLDASRTLVGVEVRARRARRTGSAAESVDRRRLHRLRGALTAFAVAEGAGRAYRGLRLDLVTVEPGPDGSRTWLLRRVRDIGAW